MLSEIYGRIQGVVERWGALPNGEREGFEIESRRALLNLAAFEDDAKRSLRGERPIRTDYPVQLPGMGAYEVYREKAIHNLKASGCPLEKMGELGFQAGEYEEFSA